MKKLNVLWIGKTGDANAWYHIYPFALSKYCEKVHIVRYRKALREIPNTKYYTFKSKSFVTEIFQMFFTGLSVLKKENIDCIVTFNPIPWGSVAWLLSKISKKKLIMGYIGKDYHYFLKKSIFRRVLSYITKHTEIITVTGKHMIDYISSLGNDKNNIVVYPHCVDSAWFVDSKQNFKKYDLITTGQLIKRKRIHDIIDAVYHLHLNGINLSFCIVGDGPEREFLEQKVDQLGIMDMVHFIGFSEDIISYLSQSKLFVQASDNEGLSLSLIEAMVVGLVPITTIAGSEEDHIIDKNNGYFFSIGDTLALSSKIEIALNEENYKRVLDNVLKYRVNFSIENAITLCDTLLERIRNEE
jgi:glycosyltransferase involved in cell wall biosynthesis